VTCGARAASTPGGWEQLSPWLAARIELPVGPLFCIIDGPTRGRSWSSAGAGARVELVAAGDRLGIQVDPAAVELNALSGRIR
jgi:hypothetical protein